MRLPQSRRIGWRVVFTTCFLFLMIPPAVAYAYTNYRYGSGTALTDGVYEQHQTSGFLNRQYNHAYRNDPACRAWRVRYYSDETNITWQNDSDCSPTSIGLTTGPRRSWCRELDDGFWANYAYNCDTTIP